MRSLILIALVSFLFFGCSSKKVTLNEQLDSFSVSKDIYVSKVPQKVNSNFHINLGTSSYIKNVGIHIGTVLIPKLQNSDGLDLQNAVRRYDINLENLIFKAFNRNFKNDEHYKNYYVTFGGKYSMNIDVMSYRLDSSFLSDRYQVNFDLKAMIKNEKNEIVYEKRFITKSLGEGNQYLRDKLLSNEEILKESLNLSLDNVIEELIQDMKKN